MLRRRWETPRVLLRLGIWPMILLATCSPLPAEPAEATSPAVSERPLMVPLSLCEEQLTLLEQQSLEQLKRLENDCAKRLREAVQKAAADTARPLLVALAGASAERDEERLWKGRWRAIALGSGAVALGMAGLVVLLTALLVTPQAP